MNYQGPYYKNRNDNTYLKKLSTQLLAVLIIMLLLLILKFVNNDITSKLNSKVKESFYKDYTKETVEIFNNFAPNTKEVFNKLISKKSEFIIDSMPAYGSIIDSTDKDNNYSIKIKTTEKAEVKAVYDGRVERVENDEETGVSIIINHGNGFESRYGCLSDIKVSEGEDVTKGSIIGLSGKDKNSENCIIFALLKDGKPVNVEEYLKK